MKRDSASYYTRRDQVMSYAKPAQNNGNRMKYHCMVTGEKRQFPCGGCVNPKGCLSSSMQYKEHEDGV